MEDLQGGTLALEHRYEIEAREGRVAQTTSYRASQYPFSKPVVVSVFDVFEESDAPDSLIDRIKNASQEWSQLTHPGILGCIDYGELTAKVPFVVSERIKAPTLQQWLESSRTMSPEDVVTLVQRLAEIIDFMHAEDVVHGGLGAHCVLLPDEAFDSAVVGHVGLALTMVDLRALESAILTYSSVAPLPPEAFTDDALPEPSWDIYALAALAYTALAAEHPFFDDVNDTSEGLLKIASGEMRGLTEFGIEEEVADVVAKGLGARASRWKTAGSFAKALAACFVEETEDEASAELEASAPEPTSAEDEHEERVASDLEPTPGGAFIGLLILALVLSNLGWAFSRGAAASDTAAMPTSESGGDSRAVLRTRLRIDSVPSDATVKSVSGGAVEEVGRTPLMVSSDLGQDGVLELVLEHPEHGDTRVDLKSNPDGQDVVVHLTPK